VKLAAHEPAEVLLPFGTLLRHYRLTAGLTQDELADRANLSSRGISDLERGARRAPHPQTLRQLSTALGLADDEEAVLVTAGRRTQPSRVADDTSTAVSKSQAKRLQTPSWVAIAAAVVVVLLGVGALMVPRATSPVATSTAPTTWTSPAANGPLVLADSFAEPASGLFSSQQAGTSQASFSDGTSNTYQWDVGYAYSALVAHALGPYPANPDSAWLAGMIGLDRQLPRNFAVQVRARATRSLEVSAYGLAVQFGPDQQYQFDVAPDDQRFRLTQIAEQAPLATDRSGWILMDSHVNTLRMEVRDDTLRLLANGHELATLQPTGLAARQAGTLSLRWAMTGQPTDRNQVEVRFADLQVYALP